MIYGMTRAKNESRWIGRIIDSFKPICEKIVLMDDHSEDDTAKIAADHGAIVFPNPATHPTHMRGKEAIDKDVLLARLWQEGAQIGDVAVHFDADELLHPEDGPKLAAAMYADTPDGKWTCNAGDTLIIYLWNSENQIRVDRWYKAMRRPSVFRLISRDLSFMVTRAGGGFHCSNVPQQFLNRRDFALLPQQLPVRLIHFGYMHREDRIRKLEFYNRTDPNNRGEDMYRHMCIGDLPGIPASSVLKHAGPLELAPYEWEGMRV